MEPTDFFKTAKLLKTYAKEEAHVRTSIGRSYYAAFLFFREWLRTRGLEKKIKPSQDNHAFVIQCLAFSRVSEGSKASQYLHDLQQVREDADYRLDKKLSKNDAEDTFVKARKAVDNIKKISPLQKKKNSLKKPQILLSGSPGYKNL